MRTAHQIDVPIGSPMNTCSYCGFENREGFLFCDDCGQKLPDTPVITHATTQFDQSTGDLNSHSSWGTARFQSDSYIVFHVRDHADPIVLYPTSQIILGRFDDQNPRKPDVDLSPFHAVEKGVSRIHAVIERLDETLVLTDLNSANGTHLNGQRLVPDQPRVLRDGDEVRLGKLVAHIYFKSGKLEES